MLATDFKLRIIISKEEIVFHDLFYEFVVGGLPVVKTSEFFLR